MLLLASSAIGCAGPDRLSLIDQQVDSLIRDRQAQALGQGSQNDTSPLPPDRTTAIGQDLYDPIPTTVNPAAKHLAVENTSAPDQQHLPKADRNQQVDAQTTDALSLDIEGALAYAIAHSREYRREKENLFLATLAFLREEHLWGPRFFDTVTSQFAGTPESGDHDQAFELINELRVTQRLPYGGEVSASALVTLVDQLRAASGSTATDQQDAELVLEAAIPLLRGAGWAAREDLIQAKRGLVYAVRAFERYRREFLVDISTSYYELLRSQAEIENLKHQVDNLDWLSRRITALAEAGREPYFEVQRSEAQAVFARNNLLNARERYANALDRFKIQLGMRTTDPLVVVPADVNVADPVLDPVRSVQSAYRLRLDLQTTGDRVNDARRRVRVASNQLLPDLDLFADVTLPSDPDKKYAGLDVDAGSAAYTAGVTFGVPLDRRIESLDHRESLIEMERAHRDYAQQRDAIALQVRSAIRSLEQAKATLGLQNRNIDLAQKRLRGVVLRLRALGPRDFIEAQEDLLDAMNSRDEALRDVRVSLLQYLVATGQMRVTPQGQWQLPAKLEPIDPAAAPDNAQRMMEAS